MKRNRSTSILMILLIAAVTAAVLPFACTSEAGKAYAADKIKVTSTKTDIRCEGGAAILGDGYGMLFTDGGGKIALIDSKGRFIRKYSKKYADTDYNYRVDGDIVSLTTGMRIKIDGMKPRYYKLKGTKLTEIKTDLALGSPMYDGYAVGYVKDGKLMKPVVINKKGRIAYRFPDKYALKKSGSDTTVTKYGNKFKASYYYDGKYWIGTQNEGLIPIGLIVRKNGEAYVRSVSVFNVKGKKLFTIKKVDDYYFYSDGMMIVEKNGKYGFVDKKGKLKIKCKYDSAYRFENGYAPVCKNGKWGYINKKGKVVIPFKYDSAYGYGDGLFTVVKGDSCGVLDIDKNVVVPFEYFDLSSFHAGVAYGVKNNKLYILKVKK